MKLTIKNTLAFVFLAAITYTSCKKASTKPTTTPTDNKKVAAQIATNIYNSLSGVKGSQGLQVSGKLRVNSTAGILCGYKKDTLYIRDDNQGDTLKAHTVEAFKYLVTCDNDMGGYIAYDSLATEMTNPGYNLKHTNVLNFVVKSLNDEYTKFNMNGSMAVVSNIIPIKKQGTNPPKYDYLEGHYRYKDVIFTVKNTQVDFTGAVVTFKGRHIYDGGNIDFNFDDYTGSIEFLADHKATIIYNGTTYTYNLLTGTIL